MDQYKLENGLASDYVWALIFLSLFCGSLTGARFALAGNFDYWFLVWNLILAWLPVLFGWFLYKKTSKHGLVWSKINILLFVLWLLFLPNAFYLLTDFIHLYDTGDVEFLYDIVLFNAYAVTGLILGYTALILVHVRAFQRFGKNSNWLVVGTLLASGLAIYLGRFLRWNSWDILFNPFGILFDLSERFINPSEYTLTFATTILFFIFLGLVYLVIFRAVRAIKSK